MDALDAIDAIGATDAVHATDATAPEVHTLSLWRNRDFVVLFSSQLASLIGRNAADVTLPLLALYLSHSALVLAVTGALRWVPYLVFGVPAGVLADRLNRRTIMIVCDSLRALLFVSIPVAAVAGALTSALVMAVAVGEAAVFVFFDAAEQGALPQFGETKRQISDTYSALGVATNAGQLVGPLVGTALYGVARSLPFLGTALALGGSVVSLVSIHTSLNATVIFLDELTIKRSRMSAVTEGFTWLWRHPTLQAIACLSGLGNIVVAAYPYILIFYAASLHLSPLVTGLVLVASGLGGTVGAFMAAPLMRWRGFASVFIAASLLQAVLWPTILLAHTWSVLALVAASSSWVDQVVSLAQQGYRGQMIDDHVIGRVQSVFRMLLTSGMPLGFVLFGVVTQAFGFEILILGGTAALTLLGVITWISPAIRHAPTSKAAATVRAFSASRAACQEKGRYDQLPIPQQDNEPSRRRLA